MLGLLNEIGLVFYFNMKTSQHISYYSIHLIITKMPIAFCKTVPGIWCDNAFNTVVFFSFFLPLPCPFFFCSSPAFFHVHKATVRPIVSIVFNFQHISFLVDKIKVSIDTLILPSGIYQITTHMHTHACVCLCEWVSQCFFLLYKSLFMVI